ncbi:MAG TPA: hypothetical protein VF755_05730, partial [Catenuloplanes sp.]
EPAGWSTGTHPAPDETIAGVIELPAGSWWDWDVLDFDGCRLRLAAGHDLTYHHGLEVIFTDVTYLACPTQFHDPQFREPTHDERALARRHAGEEPPIVVAFDVAAQVGDGHLPCLVAAESVEVVRGLVYRYPRDDPATGERPAAQVRPPAPP